MEGLAEAVGDVGDVVEVSAEDPVDVVLVDAELVREAEDLEEHEPDVELRERDVGRDARADAEDAARRAVRPEDVKDLGPKPVA